jgi:hypothetical protein
MLGRREREAVGEHAMLVTRMTQQDLEQLLVARGAIEELARPLRDLMSETVSTDTFRSGLLATDDNHALVLEAADRAREVADILRPIAERDVNRDVVRAVNLLDGIGWSRMDSLFGPSIATSDSGDILRHASVRQAEVVAGFAELGIVRATRQAAADLRLAAS